MAHLIALMSYAVPWAGLQSVTVAFPGHSHLLYKDSVDHKLLRIKCSMNSQAHSCVSLFGSLSDFLYNVMSDCCKVRPFPRYFFPLFLADLDTFIQFDADVGITLEQISICLLIFADDGVFFSQKCKDLISSNIAINGILH